MNRVPLSLLKKVFPSIIWETNSNNVHLTFDDGPDPIATPILLNLLKEKRAKGTFFVVGKNAERHPEIVKRMAEEGHAIGHHSYCHQPMMFRSRTTLEKEFTKTEHVLQEILGESPRMFRPPYGLFDSRVLRYVRQHGYRFVMWSIDSRDYTSRSAEKIARKVISATHEGAILLFHDNHATQDKVEEVVGRVLSYLERTNISASSLPV